MNVPTPLPSAAPKSPAWVDWTDAAAPLDAVLEPRADTTQEIRLEDVLEISAKTEAKKMPPLPTGASRIADDVERVIIPVELPTLRSLKAVKLHTLALETLRVPALTLAQAKSALGEKTTALGDDLEKTLLRAPKPIRFLHTAFAFLRSLPTPIWASASAVVAAGLVAFAAIAASGGHTNDARDNLPAIDAKFSGRDAHVAGGVALSDRVHRAETTMRWADLPTFVGDVPVDSLPKR